MVRTGAPYSSIINGCCKAKYKTLEVNGKWKQNTALHTGKKRNWQKQTKNEWGEKSHRQQTSNANLFQNHIFCFIGIFALVSISWASECEWARGPCPFTWHDFVIACSLFHFGSCHTSNPSHFSTLIFVVVVSYCCLCVCGSHDSLSLAWNWHKTWAVLFICLLAAPKNR